MSPNSLGNEREWARICPHWPLYRHYVCSCGFGFSSCSAWPSKNMAVRSQFIFGTFHSGDSCAVHDDMVSPYCRASHGVAISHARFCLLFLFAVCNSIDKKLPSGFGGDFTLIRSESFVLRDIIGCSKNKTGLVGLFSLPLSHSLSHSLSLLYIKK